MFKKLTLTTVLAALVAISTSTAFAAPKQGTVQPTGAERFQDRGLAEDSGISSYHQ